MRWKIGNLLKIQIVFENVKCNQIIFWEIFPHKRIFSIGSRLLYIFMYFHWAEHVNHVFADKKTGCFASQKQILQITFSCRPIIKWNGIRKRRSKSCFCSQVHSLLKLFFPGLEAMGLELFVPVPSSRTPTVTTVKVPEGVDWKAVTVYAMEK